MLLALNCSTVLCSTLDRHSYFASVTATATFPAIYSLGSAWQAVALTLFCSSLVPFDVCAEDERLAGDSTRPSPMEEGRLDSQQ